VQAYLIKRLLLIPITLFGITFITFMVMKLAPGDPAQALKAQFSGGNMAAAESNQKVIIQWRKDRHLDEPLWKQYGYWMRDLAHFDLGRSYITPSQSVQSIIWDRMWITILMNVIAFGLMYSIAIPIGIVGAAKQFTIWDRILTILPFLLYSLPTFWVGTLLIAYVTKPWLFPTSGYYAKTISEVGFVTWTFEWTRHLALPIFCETYAYLAFLSRQMRSSLLEQVRLDFIRTARAKGLPERVVILRHATRNALIPIVTLLGSLLPAVLAGTIIIEQLFSIPGMGQLFIEAVYQRDYPVLMGIEVVSALLTLFGMLLSDVLYVLVNPTISYE
jgi:peptide/nickel transport system permease protein